MKIRIPAAFPVMLASLFAVLCPVTVHAQPPAARMFRITVVDNQTSRGIPRVRLLATNNIELFTDSAGVAAFYNPDLMDKQVYFGIESYGYTYPADPLGNQGVTLLTSAGGSAVLAMHRQLPAQRLYRITGEGIYEDSIKLGDTVPPTQDVSAVPLMGMDSVGTAVYKGQIYWHWGDTRVSKHRLGNFRTTCATSDLPGMGGLDPDQGVSLTYFRTAGGDPKPMVTFLGQLVWINSMRSVRDALNQEKLVAHYTYGGFTLLEQGMIVFNDTTKEFDKLVEFPLNPVVPLGRHLYFYNDGGTTYSYGGAPWPTVRSLPSYEQIQVPSNAEAFTCLKPGSVYDGSAGQIDRDINGKAVWGWKANTSPPTSSNLQGYVSANILSEQELGMRLTDINTGKLLWQHAADAFYSKYRQRWISVYTQLWTTGADSLLGETWFVEADTPLGPWIYTEKVNTHKLPDKTYSWYNPDIHPEFELGDGRMMYFEGTYTSWLSGTDKPTPRFDYNQDMYKLDLADPRMFLPVPVYRTVEATPGYWTKLDLPDPDIDRDVVFFAPDRQREATIPVYEYLDTDHATRVLTTDDSLVAPFTDRKLVFYAYDRTAVIPSQTAKGIVDLNEFVNGSTQARIYSTDATIPDAGYVKSADAVCKVWKTWTDFQPHKVQ